MQDATVHEGSGKQSVVLPGGNTNGFALIIKCITQQRILFNAGVETDHILQNENSNGDADDRLGDDRTLIDAPTKAGHGLALLRLAGSNAFRALKPDRSRGHAVRTNGTFTPAATYVGFPAKMLVAGRAGGRTSHGFRSAQTQSPHR